MGRRRRLSDGGVRVELLLDAELLDAIDRCVELEGLDRSKLVRGVMRRWCDRRLRGLDPEVDTTPAPDPITETERRIDQALAIRPRLTDPQIAERLDLTVDQGTATVNSRQFMVFLQRIA